MAVAVAVAATAVMPLLIEALLLDSAHLRQDQADAVKAGSEYIDLRVKPFMRKPTTHTHTYTYKRSTVAMSSRSVFMRCTV